jgi:anti-sigma factor RsiW
MDYEAQLKLQSYLDGELPEAEARQVANWLAQDQEATALLAELRNTRQAMAGFENGLRLPESREFYWSKIKREIERLEPRAPVREPTTPIWVRLRRLLVPLSVAAVAVAAILATNRQLLSGSSDGFRTETALADSGAFTYHDYSAGTTLVWLSYPADNEVADTDETGTLE